MAQDGTWLWYPVYSAFGAVSYVATNAGFNGPADLRFPGQWFQLESGPAYNWHRHYDATTGRYAQPDPLRVDEREGATVGGVSMSSLQPQASLVDQIYMPGARGFDAPVGLTAAALLIRSNFPDGPSVYGYSAQSPLAKVDPRGLLSSIWPYTSRPASDEKCSIQRVCPNSGRSIFNDGGIPRTTCIYDCSHGAANDNDVRVEFLGIVECRGFL
jgi:RHS repeat-associated protein